MSKTPKKSSSANAGGLFIRTRRWPLAAITIAVVTVVGLFQNCSGYEPLDNPLYNQILASECIAANCTQDLNYLALYVGNTDPVTVTRNTERAVDLGGYCDNAGYPDTRIYIEIKNGATSVLPNFLTTAKCDASGRFRVLVTFPATYDYNLAYTIVVVFRAVDSAGNEYDHPAGANRREIALLTAP